MTDSKSLTPYTDPLPTGEELETVRARIKDCRKRAVKVDWRDDPLSRATPLEIAVAEADKGPDMCVAHSTRSGLPCGRRRNLGTTVCPVHGGSLKRVKKAARARLAGYLNRALANLEELAEQREHYPTAHAANKTIVDKIFPSLKREEGKREKDVNRGPNITVGVVLGGAAPTVQVTSGTQKTQVALPAARDADIVDEE